MMKLLNNKTIFTLCAGLALILLPGCESNEGIPSDYSFSGDEESAPPPGGGSPVADAGIDQKVMSGMTVTLDGSASVDPDGDTLEYHWVFTEKPVTSSALLLNPLSLNPTFTTDVDGTYNVELTVSDGSNESSDSVSIGSYTVSGITTFNQTVPAEDGDGEVFPGQANKWDIDSDGSLDDGWDDQFDGALEIDVNGNSFPYDQTYADLTYSTPLFGFDDGVKIAALADNTNGVRPLNGNYSLLLNQTSRSNIYQEIDLSSATAPLEFKFEYNAGAESYDIGGRDYYLSVIVIDSNGTKNETKIIENIWNDQDIVTMDFSAYAGQNITLAFEFTSDGYYVAKIDDVSIKNAAGTVEYVQNGDFESGTLDHWVESEPVETQNMTMGTRTVGGVDVTRSFYTKPNSLWGRWVDTYENNTASIMDINVTYDSNLGSDDCGIIYYTPNAGNKALTTWDGDNSDRDIGFVFGNASRVEFYSDDGLCKDGDGDNGDDYIYFYYDNISIPANSKVSIVNFIVMNGKDTSDTATDINAKAIEIDETAKAIVDGMAAGTSEYFEGMTDEQKATILNF